jgi:hypothetical protein
VTSQALLGAGLGSRHAAAGSGPGVRAGRRLGDGRAAGGGGLYSRWTHIGTSVSESESSRPGAGAGGAEGATPAARQPDASSSRPIAAASGGARPLV